MFPVHGDAHTAVKDISRWRDFVKPPNLDFPEEMWEEAKAEYKACNRAEQFIGPAVFPGVFEQLHALIKQYGDRISFMAGIDSAEVDKPGWNVGDIRRAVRRACEACGKLYFIPCLTQGGPISVFEGVCEAVSEGIDRMSEEMF
jgi:hypothetical protein